MARNEPLRDPWCAHVARRAARPDRPQRVREAVPARRWAAARRSSSCPHPVVETEADMARATARGGELRAPLEAAGMRTLVVAPGDLNEAKRLDARAGRRGEPRSVRSRGLGGASHHGLRHRRGGGGRAPGRARDPRARRRGRGVPGVARRGRRGGGPALPAPGRGERIARARDAGGQARRGERHGHLPRRARTNSCCAWPRVRPTPPSSRPRLRTLVEDPELRARMGAAARDHMERRAVLARPPRTATSGRWTPRSP